jgi:predicted HAD superfamily Cof-like phosphohydrolase
MHVVREFHETFGHPISDAPTPSTAELRLLRVRLIAEELCELARASGVLLSLSSGLNQAGEMVSVQAINQDYLPVDIVEMADALGDLDYVVQGANLVFGFPAPEITAEIHRSNMSKLGEDGKPIYREDKKVLKGPNYSPPNILAVLRYSVEGPEIDFEGVPF